MIAATVACELITVGPVDEPQIDLVGEYEIGLFCGLEDRELQGDVYAACRHGFEQGVERALEWAQGIVKDVATAAERISRDR